MEAVCILYGPLLRYAQTPALLFDPPFSPVRGIGDQEPGTVWTLERASCGSVRFRPRPRPSLVLTLQTDYLTSFPPVHGATVLFPDSFIWWKAELNQVSWYVCICTHTQTGNLWMYVLHLHGLERPHLTVCPRFWALLVIRDRGLCVASQPAVQCPKCRQDQSMGKTSKCLSPVWKLRKQKHNCFCWITVLNSKRCLKHLPFLWLALRLLSFLATVHYSALYSLPRNLFQASIFICRRTTWMRGI